MREVRTVVSRAAAMGEGDEAKVTGLGIVYDQWTEIWPGYKERIKKGSMERAVTVKSYFNHDPSQVLSTLDSDPALELKESDKGVDYVSPIPPTSYGNDLKINLARGNVRGSSFAFDVPKDGDKRWEEGGVFYRDISKFTLHELGPVTDPAYIQTTAGLRSAEDALEEWKKSQGSNDLALRKLRQQLLETGV